MKSIKTKITISVLICTLISVCVCGVISIQNVYRTSYKDSKRIMELNTQEQSQKINGMLQRVSQSVDTVYNIAIADLEDPE